MPRKPLYRTKQFPYHITARCNNREPFYLPTVVVWRIFKEILEIVRQRYGWNIHAFVLMSNHFHLIASTPEADLGECMNYFLREVSKEIGRVSGRINRIFGARYHWSLITYGIYYSHAYKYVFRNPVEAGLSSRVEEYPFSTVRNELQFAATEMPTQPQADFETFLPQSLEKRLAWLNHPYRNIQTLLIQRGLRRSEFQFPKQTTLRFEVETLLDLGPNAHSSCFSQVAH